MLSLEQSSRSLFTKWLMIALMIRVIRAYTHSTWNHPDEWFQTIELGHLISQGTATWSQEVALHLRNLTWPLILAAPLKIASLVSPTDIHLRLFATQLLSGLLDLGLIWGWWRMVVSLTEREHLSARFQNLALALVILPWCLASNSTLLSIEHVSSIALWLMLGFLTLRKWGVAGFFSIAIFAFRYPSGLLSAGAGLAVAIEGVKSGDRGPVVKFALGATAGLLLFGIPDALFYGRPWESLWMYLQYNVITGLGSEVFGQQSASVYLNYFHERWLNALLPTALVLVVATGMGFHKQLPNWKNPQPWFFALLFYLMGHLMVAHKEPRFMAPIELLILWMAIEGLAKLTQVKRFRGLLNTRSARTTVSLAFILNAAMLVKVLIGDTWNKDDQYFQLSSLLRKTPNACGIVSIKRYGTILYPIESSTLTPKIPIGYFDLDQDGPGFPPDRMSAVVWTNRKAKCEIGQTLLVQTHRPDPHWQTIGCDQTQVGPYAVLKSSLSEKLTERRLIGGPWYKCPGTTLKELGPSSVERPIARAWRRLGRLPHLRSTGDDLMKIIEADPLSSQCGWTCFHIERKTKIKTQR